MTLSIRLEPQLEMRLEKLAKETGRTKSHYVSRALAAYIEDMEDVYIALERLENPPKRYLSTEEVARSLGIELDSPVGPKSPKKPSKAGKARSKPHS